jgi:hypothetical protein
MADLWSRASAIRFGLFAEFADSGMLILITLNTLAVPALCQ